MSAFADAGGDVDISIGDYIAANPAKDGQRFVSVNQYLTGVGDETWATRAFVYGSTSFAVPKTARLIVEDGVRRIDDIGLLPALDDFDLISDKWYINLVNDNYLHDLVDPYDIGRTVNLSFTEDSRDYLLSTFSGTSITAADAPSSSWLSSISYAEGLVSYLATDFISDLLYSAYDVTNTIKSMNEYFHDGKNIVYGSNQYDNLTPDSVSYLFADSDAPNIYVGGAGDDQISTSDTKAGEIALGGYGNDTIYLFGPGATGYGGHGDDIFFLDGDETVSYGEAGHDTFYGSVYSETMYGGTGDDTFYSGGGKDLLDGGNGVDKFHLVSSGAVVFGGAHADEIHYDTDGPTPEYFFDPTTPKPPYTINPDRFADAGTADYVYVDGSILRGGREVFFSETGELGNWKLSETVESPDPDYYLTVNADQNAIYWVNGTELGITMRDGHGLIIEDYSVGDARISASEPKVVQYFSVEDEADSLVGVRLDQSLHFDGLMIYGVRDGWQQV